MHFSNQNKKNSIPKKNNICPQCSFNNHPPALYCEICFHPLNAIEDQFKQYQPKKSVTITPPLNIVEKQSSDNLAQELRSPSVISGLLVLGLAIALWFNYFLDRRPKYISANGENKIALYKSIDQVQDVPSGLFSYGGALYFASLVAHGMNDTISQDYPEFNLRYTKPTNQDPTYAHGIKMLLDGELSFAFNGRPLTDQEYVQAKLRNMKLLQIPIAIDGIAVFGNNNLAINNLTLDQVQDIFSGKITNWQQLGGVNLPITPILLTPENLEILALPNLDNVSKKTQYAANYTLAVRKVIAIPGTISLASASLIQNQQGIKVFHLAAENSANYIAPMIKKQPNLKLFENGAYPLTRRLFVVIRQDGTPDQLAGKAYAEMLLSNQGQSIVEASGFVPLYNQNYNRKL
jgi:phosphate transport system substrate-binding protein